MMAGEDMGEGICERMDLWNRGRDALWYGDPTGNAGRKLSEICASVFGNAADADRDKTFIFLVGDVGGNQAEL